MTPTRISVHIPGGGGTSYGELFVEAPPEMCTFVILEVYERARETGVLVFEDQRDYTRYSTGNDSNQM